MRFDVGRFLDDVTEKSAVHYVNAINEMSAGALVGNATVVRAGRKQLEEVIRETVGTAEIMGAAITLQRAATILGDHGASLRGDRSRMLAFGKTTIQTVLPHHTFDEAIQNMIDRTPVTIRAAAERTAQQIAKLYSESTKPIIAFARAAEASVTKHAQATIAEMIRDGSSEVDAGARLAKDINAMRVKSRKWSASYSRMVFRTNVNTGATAGRFRQARDPDIAEVIPGFVIDAIMDGDTRPHHAAADGIKMRTSDPRWAHLATPLGWNCRCDLVEVTVFDDTNWTRNIPAGAHPDVGFRHGGRPDLMLAGRT